LGDTGESMLESLGLDAEVEQVYRALLTHKSFGVNDLAVATGMPETRVRESLDALLSLNLVRPSAADAGSMQAIGPHSGLTALLAKAEADVAARVSQIEATRAAIAALAVEHETSRERVPVVRLADVDAVRSRLNELAHSVRSECVSLTPGGAQSPEAMTAGRVANQVALGRGVKIRNVYQESFRNDPSTVAYARWMTELGGLSRTVPVVPLQLVIVDREIALIPVDTADRTKGALEIHSEGMVAALCLLFEQMWDGAVPLGERPEPAEHGLEPSEQELIKLLGAGLTDEAAARRLGLSLRTVRRMMSDLTDRLGAVSRFQAGALAKQNSWL
jgi:DNA-binding CsgD family transcriptional regulator/sugar-specific transcriptional regulator TrmB